MLKNTTNTIVPTAEFKTETVSASKSPTIKKLKNKGILMALLPLSACGGGSSGGGGGGATNPTPPAPPAEFIEDPAGTFIARDNRDTILDQSDATADLTVTGKGGDDIIKTGTGGDTIEGGAGADFIRSGEGIDNVDGGSGNDAIVIVGTTTAAQYTNAAITNSGGSGTDLSSLITLADLNGRAISEVGPGEVIDGGTGTNTLFIYGTVDLTGITLNNVTVLVVNSDVTLTPEQIAAFTTVDGDGNSVINIQIPPGSSDNYILDLSAMDVADIAAINIDGDITVVIDDATDVAGIAAISVGSGDALTLEVNGTGADTVVDLGDLGGTFSQIDTLDIDSDVTIKVDNPADITVVGLTELTGTGEIETDGSSGVDDALDAITIDANINTVPHTENDVAAGGENQILSVDVLVNDSDRDSDTLTLSNATVGTNQGSVSIVSGEVRFDPGTDFDYLATDETEDVDVTYFVSDSKDSQEGTLTITLTGENDAPDVAGVDLGSTNEDTPIIISTAQLLANSSDVDGDTLSVSNVAVDAQYGTVTNNGNGTYTFTPKANYHGDNIPITYTVGDASLSDDTTATIDVIPQNDAPGGTVSISGTATEDQTLSASNTLTDIDGIGAISYQWQRDGEDITGATSEDYTLTQDDVGALITVTANYTDDDGSDESVASAPTTAVANVNDDPQGTVSITGTFAEGFELSADNNLTDEDGIDGISYQWQRGGVNIIGATSANYTLTSDDVDADISVLAKYTDGEETDEEVSSGATNVTPAISIANISADEVDETATFTVTLSSATTNAVSVDYTAPDGSSGTLNFAPGDTEKTFVTAWSDDSDAEADEVVDATLTNPTGAAISDGAATLTIIDDDGPVITVSDEIAIAAELDIDENIDQVAWLPDGGYVVLHIELLYPWMDGVDTENQDSYLSIYNADGTLRAEVQVSTPAGLNSYQHDMVVLSDGTIVVGSISGATSFNEQVTWSSYSAQGVELSANNIVLNSGGQIDDISMAANANDDIAFTFVHNNLVKVRIIESDGSAKSGVSTVNTYTSTSQALPDITALDNGNLAITWRINREDGEWGSDIRYQVVSDSGVKIGNELSFRLTDDATSPSITTLNNGQLLLTWNDRDSDDINVFTSDIYGQLFSATGTAISDPVLLLDKSDGQFQRFANAEAFGDDGFVLVWFEKDNALWSAVFEDINQDPVFKTQIDETNNSRFGLNEIAVNDDGELLVAWNTLREGTSVHDVYLKEIDYSEVQLDFAAMVAPESLEIAPISEENILYGDDEENIFTFEENWGEATIIAFEDGMDTIDLSATGLTFEDLTISGNDNHTVITDTEGNQINLQNVDALYISADDFLI